MSTARGCVQTVLGPVAPETLGATLMHEHVLCDLTVPELAAQQLPEVEIRLDNAFEIRHHWCRHYGNHVLNDLELAVDELLRYRTAGGSALVELTCEGIAPDANGLAKVAERTGLHIVAGCGPYVEAHLTVEQRARTIEQAAEAMVRAVSEGIDGSGVRAGILGEIGVSTPCTAVERKSLLASVLAQSVTGAAINVHPPRTLRGTLEVIEILAGAGAEEQHSDGHLSRPESLVEEERQESRRQESSGQAVQGEERGDPPEDAAALRRDPNPLLVPLRSFDRGGESGVDERRGEQQGGVACQDDPERRRLLHREDDSKQSGQSRQKSAERVAGILEHVVPGKGGRSSGVG